MDNKHKLIRWITESADLSSEPVPAQFLLELLGQDRVLIENHRGIREYGCEKIGVKAAFGSVTVCGEALELCRVSKERLIIRGKIDSIQICRRGR